MRSGGCELHRITLTPMDFKFHDFFLYSSPKAENG